MKMRPYAPLLHYAKTTLIRDRGWTEAGIAQFLGKADSDRVNPYYSSGARMQLYLRSRVEEVEKSRAYAEWKQESEVRKSAAQQAVHTKREHILSYVAALPIQIPKLTEEELVTHACRNYNTHWSGSRHNKPWADPDTCDEHFLYRIMVNYLRHRLTNYEEELTRIYGHVGRNEAWEILKKRVLEAIASQYPILQDECVQQIKKIEAGYQEGK